MWKFVSKKSIQNVSGLYFFQVIIVIVSFCSVLNGQETIRVTGRVVDENGKPLANANTSFVPECNNCFLDVVFVDVSDANGFFSGELQSKMKFYLFIEEAEPTTHWSPMRLIDFQIKYLTRYSIPIYFRRKPKTFFTDLGSFKPTIQYLKTEIDLQKFITSEVLQSKDYSKIKIQTKDYNGRIVRSRLYVEEKYWTDSSKIKLALPKGEWILEIFVKENGKEKKVGSIRLLLQAEKNIKQFYSAKR